MEIIKKEPSDEASVKHFFNEIDFKLPLDFIDFYKENNGAEILIKNKYFITLWPLAKILQLNVEYQVKEYAPDYFIFGTNGGGMAYCIEKTTGNIFEMPFIGMSNDKAIFKSKSLKELFKD